MPITVPVRDQEISAETFGAPVANQLNGLIPTAWVNPAFLNGWANMAGFLALRYRKVSDAVTVQGCITGGTLGSAAFNLPIGFRPTGDIMLVTGGWSGSAWIVNRLRCLTSGDVIIDLGANQQVPIDLRFATT